MVDELADGFTMNTRQLMNVLAGPWRRHTPRWPVLFIVGTPRSGTTVVSLQILNSLALGYLPNTVRTHPYRPILATRVAARTSQRRFPRTFEQEDGYVRGRMGPSDGWELFHRWFPRYELDQKVDVSHRWQLPSIIASIEGVFDAPICIKNNNNSTRIDALAALFPRALFLRVRRRPIDVMASLLQLRRRLAIPRDEWWSAAPPAFWNRSFDSVGQRVAYQVAGVDHTLDQTLNTLAPHRQATLAYEEFVDDPLLPTRLVAALYERADKPVELRRLGPAVPPPPRRRGAQIDTMLEQTLVEHHRQALLELAGPVE